MAMAAIALQLLLSPSTYYTTTPPAAAASLRHRCRRRLLSTPAWSHRSSGPTSTVVATATSLTSDVPGDQQLGLGGAPAASPSGRPSAHPGGPTHRRQPRRGRTCGSSRTAWTSDHCHVRTLTQLSTRAPDLPVVTTPNARAVLASLPTPFRRVTCLEPGESTAVGQDVRVMATAGTLLGAPWQRPENGYVLLLMPAGDAIADDTNSGLLYYEPHCLHDRSFLERKRVRADVVITPVVKQLLPLPGSGNGNYYYTLVAGQEDAVELARMLRARYVVPMSDADLDAGGLLTAVLVEQGTAQSFQALLSEALPQVQVLNPTPGVPLHRSTDSDRQQHANTDATKAIEFAHT